MDEKPVARKYRLFGTDKKFQTPYYIDRGEILKIGGKGFGGGE